MVVGEVNLDMLVQNVLVLTNVLENQNKVFKRAMQEITSKEEDGTLTIPFLKKSFEKCFENREDFMKRGSSLKNRLLCLSNCSNGFGRHSGVIDEFLAVFNRYRICQHLVDESQEKYRYFVPVNAKLIQQQVRDRLLKDGYIVDSEFEGDYATWVGVYARPKDKPTYLDASTAEEAALQNKYRVDGFKRDFSEWFEWEINEGKISE